MVLVGDSFGSSVWPRANARSFVESASHNAILNDGFTGDSKDGPLIQPT